jgi:hypothetical protein
VAVEVLEAAAIKTVVVHAKGPCATNPMLVGKPEGNNRPLRRPRRRWVDNVKMDLREIV